MYNHVDQSWRNMPAFLSHENEDLLAKRISEYAERLNLKRLLIVYHGGEPILLGIEGLQRITRKIKESLPESVSVDFSMQTNGTLINSEILNQLESLNISVSLSIDGPEHIHDKHRLNHAGKPSFKEVDAALKLLQGYPKIFTGIIAVIDAQFSPRELLEYFSKFDIPSLDFLLPDANYNRLPPGREDNNNLYSNWLVDFFDLWFDEYSHVNIRFFDAILGSIVGLPSKTDALGFGNISLLTIETDGSYHDLDVLKVTYDGATKTNMNLAQNSINEAADSPQIQAHGNLLKKENLCDTCLKCDVVDICSGGAVPHRYSNEGFSNPSIYCHELYTLIKHAKRRIAEQLESELQEHKENNATHFQKVDLTHFEDTSHSYYLLSQMMNAWQNNEVEKLIKALSYCKERGKSSAVFNHVLNVSREKLKILSTQPSVFTWTSVIIASIEGRSITSIDGDSIDPDFSYPKQFTDFLDDSFHVQRVNRNDKWLRIPFGSKIQYEDAEIAAEAVPILNQAYAMIDSWDSNLLSEIKLIAPEVQFIKDITAHPDKIVSFSDNSVPGALYVTIRLGNRYIEPADLADSILHEYRHQKLYLLQRISDIVTIDVPLVPSPWREELRPPSGLYHAIYVFTFLRRFWQHLAISANEELKQRAKSEVQIITNRIQLGLETVRSTRLTQTGIELLEILSKDLIISNPYEV